MYYSIAPKEFQEVFGDMYPQYRLKADRFSDGTTKAALPVRNITVVVTEKCNLACTYCYEQHKVSRSMSKETARAIIDLLFEEDAQNSQFINEEKARGLIIDFIGGEPLLEIELMDYFMRYFRYKAVTLNHRWALYHTVNITTNGILFNTPKVQSFLFKNKDRVSCTITIDGNKELHDACRVFPDGSPSYDIVEKSVKNYQKITGGKASTKLTLAPANVSYLFDALKNLCDNLHLAGVFANCVYEEGWDYSHAKVLYEQMKKSASWMIENDIEVRFFCTLFDETIGAPMSAEENNNWCGGTGSMISFTPNGYAQPCLRYAELSLNGHQPEIRIGDIKSGIAHKAEYKENLNCLNCISRKSQSSEECFNCPIARGCAWCSGYNYEVNGTADKRVSYICPMHKARVLANRFFWQKIYKKYGIEREFKLNIPKEQALEIISKDEYEMLKNL